LMDCIKGFFTPKVANVLMFKLNFRKAKVQLFRS
jgi:hypothetical protein